MNKITKINLYQRNGETYVTFVRERQYDLRIYSVLKDKQRVHNLVRLESMIESGYMKVDFFHIMPYGEFMVSIVPAKCEDKLPVVDDPEPILFSNNVEDFTQVGWDITGFDMEEQKDIIELSNLYMLGGMDYDEAINHAVWHWNHDIKYHPNRPAPVKIIRCPECESENFLHLKLQNENVCLDCGADFSE